MYDAGRRRHQLFITPFIRHEVAAAPLTVSSGRCLILRHLPAADKHLYLSARGAPASETRSYGGPSSAETFGQEP